MTEKNRILDPNFWRNQLLAAKPGNLHHAVYVCPQEEWDAIAERHREILRQHLEPTDRILDCGCGWGRLLGLLPMFWEGEYTGVDLSPDFISMAKENNLVYAPFAFFTVGDLREMWKVVDSRHDVAVLISIRSMVIRELGQEAWDQMEVQIRKVARKLLYLEYDRNDKGSLE